MSRADQKGVLLSLSGAEVDPYPTSVADGGGGGGSSSSSNPLSAPTASAMAFDRALASLERIDQSMRDLSPVGRVNVHGAGLLSAKLKLDGASDAELANKRSKTSSTT